MIQALCVFCGSSSGCNPVYKQTAERLGELLAERRIVELDAPFEGGGLNYETAHFCELIRAGTLESPVMTHAKSMQMISMTDAARAALGLKYAGE